MDRRAKLSVALVVVGVAACVVVAAGVGADAPRGSGVVTAAAAPGKFLSDLATPQEYGLWNARGCVTCHGAEALGTPMGPDLTRVLPRYLAKFGTDDAARAALVEHLLDPQHSPKLRDDGNVFPNPMPPLERLFGGRREDAPVLAGMLLRLAK